MNPTGPMRGEALDGPRFPRTLVDGLYRNVEIDDEVDAELSLPERVPDSPDQAMLIDCFRLSRQVWTDGVDRQLLLALVNRMLRERGLDEAGRIAFKHIRARFKLLRFAFALYQPDHAYPRLFNLFTTNMGLVQDAMRNRRPGAVTARATLLRAMLARGPWSMLRREVDRFTPISPAAFDRYTDEELARAPRMLAGPGLTAHRFHAVRKIVSRQVAHYSAWHTLAPSDEIWRMFRYLSAINGLMGGMHDELVEGRAAGTHDYHRQPIVMLPQIAALMQPLVTRYGRRTADAASTCAMQRNRSNP